MSLDWTEIADIRLTSSLAEERELARRLAAGEEVVLAIDESTCAELLEREMLSAPAWAEDC
jgi:hypothetical protein